MKTEKPFESRLSSDHSATTPNPESIEKWLVDRVASMTRIDPRSIDIEEELTFYGMGSLQVVQMTGDLADWLGKPLPETLIWDYPTIEGLARHLSEEAQPHLVASGIN